MKIYTLFTDSHKDLLYQYFLPSLYHYEDAEVIIKKIPQYCQSGEYGQDGWFETMIEKVKYHIQSCKENLGQKFIYSDCDVQFLNRFIDIAIEELSDYDIACQDDVHPYNDSTTYCAGFFICNANDKTLNLFETILDSMLVSSDRTSYNDQSALNDHLSRVKHKTLSHKFYTIAQTTSSLWQEDYAVKIPTDILVHHANWTHGVHNKLKLLNFIKSQQK